MSKVLEVSKSGYYKWLKVEPINSVNNKERQQKIKSVFAKSKGTYGSPRITIELNKNGIEISKTTVAKNMAEMNIRARKRRKYVVTTESDHDFKIPHNLLNRKFNVEQPNTVWVGDITYIPVNDQFYYLTIVLDLCDRMIVGWTLSDNMTAKDTTVAALQHALNNRRIHHVSNLMFHSDRGVQYACTEFTDLLSKYNCTQSMSRKGNCWDNAVAESFFKTIKHEALNKTTFNDYNTLYKFIFRYIDGWYNTTRCHSSLNYKTPLDVFYEKINTLAA